MNPNQNDGQLPTYQDPNTPPAPVTPPVNPNPSPYDFIMNPEKPKKSAIPLPIKGGGLAQRIAIAGGGLVVLIVLAVVVTSVLGASGKEKTENLLTIAQEQTELIRIATDGGNKATTIPAQNLAQNVQATVTSDNGKLLAYLKTNGLKVSPAQLALKRSKTVDTALTTAQENSTYDTTFTEIIQKELTTYQSSLKKAYTANPGPKGQELLSSQYDAAELLLKSSQQK